MAETRGSIEIARMKAVMGRGLIRQYQQDPIPEGGAIFQREWFAIGFTAIRTPGFRSVNLRW